MSFLDRLREKTDIEKKRIAKKIAGFFAGLLVIVWVFLLFGNISKYKTNSVNSLAVVGKQVANVYLGFKDDISEVTGSVKSIFFTVTHQNSQIETFSNTSDQYSKVSSTTAETETSVGVVDVNSEVKTNIDPESNINSKEETK